MNSCVLIGRLTRDVDLKFLQNGTGVAKLTLAVDKDNKKKLQEEGKPTADFINVTIFGKQAENCSNYLSKGSQCAVHGRISTGSYEKDGKKVYTTEVVADRVEFLGTKGQATEDTNIMKDFPDNDIFEPADDDTPF